MILEKATPSDNEELLHFYNSFTKQGLFEYQIKRLISYEAPYKLQAPENKTFILRDDSQILASASFVIQKVQYMGEVTNVAYARDFRVNPSRKATLSWAQHFLPVLEELQQDCSTIFTHINLKDPQALNTFIKSRPLKKQHSESLHGHVSRFVPRHYLYKKFNIVSVHGRFPSFTSPISYLKISHATPKDDEALMNYLLQKMSHREFKPFWDLESLKQYLKNIPDLTLRDFWIAKNSQGEIVGCTAPCATEPFFEIHPLHYSARAINFYQLLKFGSYLNWTRRIPNIRSGEAFKFKLLTHLFADNHDILESLIETCFNTCTQNEFLVYLAMNDDIQMRPPRNWISTSIPYGFYSILTKFQNSPPYLNANDQSYPWLEAQHISL
jgi:hypothetical protein